MKEYKVLIVDDEIPFLKYLEDFCWAEFGFDLIGKAYNGKEALKLCVEEKPDIIISDINMPVMDGIELMRRIKLAFPDIQIILLTVIESFEYVKESISNGAVDYIVKGADNYDSIQKALDKAKNAVDININNSLMVGKKKLLSKSMMISHVLNDDIDDCSYTDANALLRESAGVLITIQFEFGDILNEIISEAIENYVIKKYMDKLFFIKLAINSYQFILKAKYGDPEAWINLFLNDIGEQFKEEELKTFAVIGDFVHNIEEYKTQHYLHKNILKQSFYYDKSRIFRNNGLTLKSISKPEANKMIHALQKAITDYEKTEMFIKQDFFKRAESELYEPEDVRKLFVEFISQYKKKYADKDDVNLEIEIMGMGNIFGMIQSFLGFVKKLLNSNSGISYEINKAIKYIEQNLGNSSLQLLEVSDHVNISQGYLSRALKEITGETFKQMLFRMRMENASFLLKNTDKKIYEVAEDSGYSNYRSFIKAFKEQYNITPKKFRSI